MLGASALLATIVASAFGLLIATIVDLRDSSRLAEHSNKVLASANELQRLVIDLETGVRAYVITRQPRFLEPWTNAQSAFPTRAGELRQLVGDNPQQEALATAIARNVRSYIDDFSRPLVATVRTGRNGAAAAVVSTGEGKRRVDAIRAQFDRFDTAERSLEATRDRNARAGGRRAILVGAVALGSSVLLVLLFAVFLARLIVEPVRRVALAARRAGSDLSVRVPEAGSSEIGELARAFNTMASSLQESHDELESQNAELEMQASELEDQGGRLAEANSELEAQHAELERAVDELAMEKQRIEAFYGFGQRLTEETEEDPLARLALQALCDLAWADLGAIYVREEDDENRFRCAAARGLGNGPCGSTLLPGEGVAGRALDERRLVAVAYGETGLTLTSFGEVIAVAHELGVPLVYGGQTVGALALARVADRPFEDEELAVIEHLAAQVAVALANAFALATARRLASINASVLDATVDGIRLVDLDGNTLLANAAIEKYTTEVLGLPSDSTLHERSVIAERLTDPKAYLATMERIAAYPEAETWDDFELAESRRAFRRYSAPVSDNSGAPIGRIIVLREITAENEAERLGQISRAILDATVDGILLADPAGTLQLQNAAMERMRGDLLPSITGTGTLWERAEAFAARTADPAAYLEPLHAIAADPDYEGMDEFELTSGRWVQRYTTAVRDAAGELIGRLFVLRETTAERQAERLKSELLATVSHELRTPLASILGFAELMVERALDDATSDRYLETIHGEAKRLTRLINDFLDLQRIEAGELSLSVVPFELGGLLEEEVGLFEGQSSRHRLELVLPDGPIEALGDRERTAQVVANLLSNAIKYSPEGGRVTITAAEHGGSVRISIGDEGLGIPPDQQQRIFTKFFRVDSSDTRSIGGTGLGLALCHDIVAAQGGRIGFTSEEGAGSTFWFELPTPRHYDRTNGHRRVLVIEDDPAAASFLTECLLGEGCTVDVAATGEDALARARVERPRLICLDITLAGELDGWQVLSRLKADPATADVPVVICTAGNGRDTAFALGAADFLTKPFSSRQLRTAVRRLLSGGKGFVLVADDDPGIRELVVETLGGDGIELGEAANGAEAMASVARRRPDAIILDLVMPELDGFEVLERLQADPDTRRIPVVVLTARRLSAEERRALSSRAVALFEKSDYSADELRDLIKRTLDA
jgi:signal transduction histidine kinase/DNA-binding response OmpR family regulator